MTFSSSSETLVRSLSNTIAIAHLSESEALNFNRPASRFCSYGWRCRNILAPTALREDFLSIFFTDSATLDQQLDEFHSHAAPRQRRVVNLLLTGRKVLNGMRDLKPIANPLLAGVDES